MIVHDTFWSPNGDNSGGGSDGQQSGAGAAGQGDLPEREWVGDLPEPLRTSKSLRKFTDASWKADLAKSYVELEGKLGKAVVVPDTSASAEEWGKFFSRVGRPEKPDEYELPEGKLDPDTEKTLRERAHRNGLSKAQASDFIKAVIEGNEAREAARKAALDRDSSDAVRMLRTEFGDRFDEKMAARDTGIRALFPEAVEARLARAGVLNDPDFTRAMVAYGEMFGETKLVRGKPAAGKPADPYDWMREKYGRKE